MTTDTAAMKLQELKALAEAATRSFQPSSPPPKDKTMTDKTNNNEAETDAGYVSSHMQAYAQHDIDRTARAAAPAKSVGEDENFIHLLVVCAKADGAEFVTARQALIAHIDSLLAARTVADAPIGIEVSMDVSTGDEDGAHRIFGRVEGVQAGTDGKPMLLAVEESRNFAAEVADATAERAAGEKAGDLCDKPIRHQTDLSRRLRDIICANPLVKRLEVTPRDLLAAANEIDRYYGGMLAWKQTAEKKDADWNRERMERVNERCADSPPAADAGGLNAALLADLTEAAAKLRSYETQHRAKGTAESTVKAEVNAELAGRFETTIAKARTAAVMAARRSIDDDGHFSALLGDMHPLSKQAVIAFVDENMVPRAAAMGAGDLPPAWGTWTDDDKLLTLYTQEQVLELLTARPTASGAVDLGEPTMLWDADEPEDGTHGDSPKDFAENYASNCMMAGEIHTVDVLCAYRGNTRTMKIELPSLPMGSETDGQVVWSWEDRPTANGAAGQKDGAA